MVTETWKPVRGFESLYAVSDAGRVKTLRPRGGAGGGSQPRSRDGVLRPGKNEDGYLHVILYSSDGRRFVRKVHVLVLEAFDRPRRPGDVAAHLNAVRDDNRPLNLRWLTHALNMAQREADGNTSRGESHGRAKITADDVRAIRAARGIKSQAALAKDYQLSPASIGFIQTRRNWAHIK